MFFMPACVRIRADEPEGDNQYSNIATLEQLLMAEAPSTHLTSVMQDVVRRQICICYAVRAFQRWHRGQHLGVALVQGQ